jgi:hypothetical protein
MRHETTRQFKKQYIYLLIQVVVIERVLALDKKNEKESSQVENCLLYQATTLFDWESWFCSYLPVSLHAINCKWLDIPP